MQKNTPYILVLIGTIISFAVIAFSILGSFVFRSVFAALSLTGPFDLVFGMGFDLIRFVFRLTLDLLLLFFTLKIKKAPEKSNFITI